MSVKNFTIKGLPEIDGLIWVQLDGSFIYLNLNDDPDVEMQTTVGKIYNSIAMRGVEAIFNFEETPYWREGGPDNQFETLRDAGRWLQEQAEAKMETIEEESK